MEPRDFGLDTPLVPPPPRRHRPRRIIAMIAVVVLAAAGGGIWAATASSSGPHGYRSATVTRQNVEQAVEQTGTIEPVAQATVAFPTSGTVDSVAVQVGDSVTVGQTLATLDTTTLEASVLKADAALASAELTLQRALDGEVTPSSSMSFAGEAAGAAQAATLDASVPSATSATQPSPNAPSASPPAQLRADEQAVLAAQQAVDTKLLAAKQAVAAASSACASASGAPPTTTTTPTTTTPTTTGGSGGPSSSTACSHALGNALAAAQALAGSQQSLASAASTLTAALGSAATRQQSAGTQSTSTSRPSRSGGTRTSGGSASAANSATSTLPSAADLITDQAAVDAAQLQVATAQQGIAQATILSPIAGSVAALSLAPGQRVSAGSASDEVVVVGASGSFEVTTTVSVDQLTHLSIGAPATVRPDGAAATLPAKVVSIGINPTTTTTATVYPVVLGLTGEATALRNGANAGVTIVLSAATSTLAVPTSAVQALAGRKVVTVLADGKPTLTPVTTGAVGDRYTAITSGLKLGQAVMLADLSQPLPSSDNSPSAVTGTGNVNVAELRRAFTGGGFGGRGAGG